jgi:hypothetical protein
MILLNTILIRQYQPESSQATFSEAPPQEEQQPPLIQVQ